MAELQGACDDRFDAVRRALSESLDKDDVGASAAVFIDGKPVVDLWGGYTDATRTAPWQRDTITCVWSVTKTMMALVTLMLADRGDLDLDAPVARYWPEFAAAGKEGVRISHLMAHTAGLPDFGEPVAAAELYDWPAITARVAAQPPRWQPGTQVGYHSLTQGFVVGEVIRRVTGRTVGEFFAEEVAGPLGADFYLGLPAEHDHRVAPVLAPPSSASGDWVAAAPGAGEAGAGEAGSGEAGAEPGDPSAGIRMSSGNTLAWRRAQIPSASGFGNARSVAAVQSILACGGTVHGVRFLSPEGCDQAAEEQFRGTDQVLGTPMRYGMGYGIFDRSIGWGGWGGSLVVVDPAARMAVSYVMNQMLDHNAGSYRGLGIVIAAYEGLS